MLSAIAARKYPILIIVLVLAGVAIWWTGRAPVEVPLAGAPSGPPTTLQTYRNAEFGFEFQYPAGWQLFPNTFTNISSKFNLVGAAPAENGHPDPLDPSISVNLVVAGSAKQAVLNLESSTASDRSEITVGGINGTKYSYAYKGESLIGVVIPIYATTTFIFEAKKSYEDVLGQILASFKILNQ